MKILHVVPNPFFIERGGLVRVETQIRMALSEGIESHVVSYHHGNSLNGVTIHRTIPIPWYKNFAPGANFHRFYLDLLLLLKTVTVGRSLKPDIIHAHLHEGLAASLPLARIYRIPLILDAEGSLTAEMKAYDFPLSRAFYPLEKVLTRSADYVLTSSEQLKSNIITRFGYPAQRCRLFGDSIDTGRFKPRHKDTELLKKYNIYKNTPVAVYLGTLNILQGIDTLMKVSSVLNSVIPEMKILIMGFPDMMHWETQCRLQGITNVVFTGKIERVDAPRHLSLGDIALAPKKAVSSEGNGKLLDYMAMGLPVVAFDTLVNREILGEKYPLVTAYDWQQFAECAVSLVSDGRRAVSMGKSLRDRACALFSENGRKIELVKTYNDLLAGCPERPDR